MKTTALNAVRSRSATIHAKIGKFCGALSLVALSLVATPTYADDESCKMALCMWGRFTGDSGGSECKSAEKKYFKIIVYRKKHKISWGSTAKKRLQALNSCAGADPSYNKKINDKFGRKKG